MTLPLNRRSFLASAAALPFALRGFAESAKPARWVFLGTDRGAGIYRCSWDPARGVLGAPELAAATARPDFFALHPTLPRLYSVNSLGSNKGAVSSFYLDAAAGSLRFAESQSSHGDGPCFVSVDETGRCAFVANYSGGSFAALRLTVNGSLLEATGTLACKASPLCGTVGPVHERQDASHLHCATVAPGNGFVLACDLGTDSIEVLAIHPERDNPLGTVTRFATRPGSGPRHVAFHPNGRWLYVIHEIDCTVELFDWSVTGKQPSLVRREGSAVSTLAAGAALTGNTACEVLVASSGRFVYACTRGEDSLVVFRVDERSGKLTEQQRLSCGGRVPRHMAFDPTGRWLLCANQSAPGSVTVFAHEPATGKLTGPMQTLEADTPMFVQFV